MAWTARVFLDHDKPNVGTVVAYWNVGQPDEFTYSRRAMVNAGDGQAFVAEAIAALVARNARAASEASLVSILEGWLNG